MVASMASTARRRPRRARRAGVAGFGLALLMPPASPPCGRCNERLMAVTCMLLLYAQSVVNREHSTRVVSARGAERRSQYRGGSQSEEQRACTATARPQCSL